MANYWASVIAASPLLLVVTYITINSESSYRSSRVPHLFILERVPCQRQRQSHHTTEPTATPRQDIVQLLHFLSTFSPLQFELKSTRNTDYFSSTLTLIWHFVVGCCWWLITLARERCLLFVLVFYLLFY